MSETRGASSRQGRAFKSSDSQLTQQASINIAGWGIALPGDLDGRLRCHTCYRAALNM
jgi:hypothetical protein